MSKKDYINTARIIKERIEVNKSDIEPASDNSNLTIGDIKIREIESITKELADMFRRDNSNFDYARFYSACGIE